MVAKAQPTGYTGHEHLPEFGLINMNGRLYDPVLGRMLSPDNNIQEGFNTQNYNRYSYVLNNPLKFNDPSGEFFNLVTGALGAAVNIGVNIAMGNVHDLGDVLYYGGTGFLAGALVPAGPLVQLRAAINAGVIAGAATGAGDHIYGAIRGRNKFSVVGLLQASFVGGALGGFTAAAGWKLERLIPKAVGAVKKWLKKVKGPPKTSVTSPNATTAIDGGANTRLDPNAPVSDPIPTCTGDAIVYTYKSPPASQRFGIREFAFGYAEDIWKINVKNHSHLTADFKLHGEELRNALLDIIKDRDIKIHFAFEGFDQTSYVNFAKEFDKVWSKASVADLIMSKNYTNWEYHMIHKFRSGQNINVQLH